MTSVFRKSALLGGAMSLALAAIATAAPAAPEAKVDKRVVIVRDGGAPHPGGPGMMRFHHRGDPAKRAEHLRDMLQLTPAQEPALQAFLDATRPPEMAHPHPGKDGGKDGDKPEHKRLTTPERLDRQAEMMAKHQAAFARRAAATRAFYAQLTPSQKKVFDALPMMHGPMMHGPGMMRHPGGPGGERRVRIIRGEGGPDGKVTWQTEDEMDGDAIFVGELGEMAEFDVMIAPPPPPPPPPPAPPAPPAPPPPPPSSR